MRMPVASKAGKRARRRFSFRGNTCADDILIGNHGNASLSARGHFHLSGILYMLDGKAEFTIEGSGQITFTGKCKHLVIKKSHGDCIIDFSELKSDLITCESLSGQVTVVIGKARRVDIIEMIEDALLRINSNPLVTAHCLDHNARIVCSPSYQPPLVVRSFKRIRTGL